MRHPNDFIINCAILLSLFPNLDSSILQGRVFFLHFAAPARPFTFTLLWSERVPLVECFVHTCHVPWFHGGGEHPSMARAHVASDWPSELSHYKNELKDTLKLMKITASPTMSSPLFQLRLRCKFPHPSTAQMCTLSLASLRRNFSKPTPRWVSQTSKLIVILSHSVDTIPLLHLLASCSYACESSCFFPPHIRTGWLFQAHSG